MKHVGRKLLYVLMMPQFCEFTGVTSEHRFGKGNDALLILPICYNMPQTYAATSLTLEDLLRLEEADLKQLAIHLCVPEECWKLSYGMKAYV